jgi:hypothetical protein
MTTTSAHAASAVANTRERTPFMFMMHPRRAGAARGDRAPPSGRRAPLAHAARRFYSV